MASAPAPAPATPARAAGGGAASAGDTSARAPSFHRLAAYGAFALPLAFAALPLYVQWPAHAATAWGLPLAAIGALLLAVRVGDAFIDPWIGTRIDTLFARSAKHAWLAAGAAAACIACGMAALMFAPAAVARDTTALLAWAGMALVLTSIGYSVATVTHQAWAVRLGGGTADQARWVGTREALALAGVIVASLLPALLGWGVTVAVLAMLLGMAWWALARVLPPSVSNTASERGNGAAVAPATAAGPAAGAAAQETRSPWRDAGFRRLMPVVLASGLASAVPASLVVLYVRDLLQAGAAAEGWVLGLYFAAAAVAMPLWVRAVRRFGLLRPWFAGMWLAIGAFAGAAVLGPGDIALFAVICIASGLALGADLVVPPAMLAGLIQRRASGLNGPAEAQTGVEGLWFGWWSFATKLTLAAAAGLALPLVQWLGYRPGARDEGSLAALAICYAALPCAIKAAAALMLWFSRASWPWAAQAERASPALEAAGPLRDGTGAPRLHEFKEIVR